MEFDLTEEQRILKQTARNFLRKECPKELVRQLNESDEGYSPELWRKMAQLGWTGLTLPEELGGSDWSFLDLVVLIEEMGYNICPGPFISTAVLGSTPIAEAGNENQKRDILGEVAAGNVILTMALTEPNARDDAASLSTTAILDGEEYVINGTKLFVPDAHVSDYLLCVARTRASADPAEGVSVFIVDRNSPGMKCTPLKAISHEKLCEVVFDGMRVPRTRVVGEVDQGWPFIRGTLEKATVARSAEMIGSAQAAMDMALSYAKERTQFGRPIGSFQAVQHYFADMWVDINGSRHLVYQAAWKLSQGIPAGKDVAMAKARAGKIGRKVTALAHQIFGAIGFTMEHDLHLYTRRMVSGDLAFGHSELQLEEVARQLGL